MTEITKRIDRPAPGTYKLRLRKGAPWIPARIVARVARDPDTGEKLDRSPRLICMVAGEEADILRYWPSMRPISRAEYDHLIEILPDNPREPVDINRSPPAF